ncbi:MAG: OmpA family protein [Deltaproteobacteria bacterium]|nr:OmpA family protein [Deltaproteobacteria bacterium]
MTTGWSRARALALAMCLWAPASARAGGLDVEAWMARPGVRLLAVEFYATWCKPCMEAVPRWKSLHERYRSKGLRLVVVATQDPQGGCVNPGWNPDDVVCDDEGRLAERLGAENLPAAFLWSWQGNLLAARAHVGDIEPMIESWLGDVPRVEVSVKELASGAGISRTELEGLVRARVRDEDKLEVVATEAERKKLAEIKKKSFQAGFDERLQCEVGKDLSANSLLEASISGDARKRLRLGLLSAERGCLVASSVVDFLPSKAAVSVAEAVAELGSKLRREAQMPGVAESGGMSEYARLKRELEQAKAEGERRKATEAFRAKVIEEAWKIVKDFASTESIPIEKRASAVSKFLEDFSEDHPFRREALALRDELRPKPSDRDRDGIPDSRDQCPDEAETVNGLSDDDGCADDLFQSLQLRPDRDGDGIPDSADRCPDRAEDKNGFRDDDGCPDSKLESLQLDSDRDGVIDDRDQCSAEPEDIDGFQDQDGCPESDNDGDGVRDDRDSCPGEPEDGDRFEDDDGCPDPDNDRDGVLDRDDQCPNEPETLNGVTDSDGCPDRGLVSLTKERIELLEQPRFATGKAMLLKESFSALNQTAQLLKDKPSLRLRIEGHTDNVGNHDANVRLSTSRAEAVRAYLIGVGIDGSRLEASGHGPERPIDSNATTAGRARNRRIELQLVD